MKLNSREMIASNSQLPTLMMNDDDDAMPTPILDIQ